MRVSLRDWLQSGWVTEHKSSTQEIRDLLALTDRDLHDCRAADLSADWRFNIAYHAALQAATAALAAAGFRAARDAHHYRVIQSLAYTIAVAPGLLRRFDAFRKKRNLTSYEMGGRISDQEAKEMAAVAEKLRREVRHWIKANHPRLL